MYIFLDTETTGFSPANGDSIVEIAIVDQTGKTLINTLVDPQRPIPYGASAVHGITNDMVRGKPTLIDILPDVRKIVTRRNVVIYNATFDVPFIPGQLREAAGVHCAMRQFASALGGPWRKLDVAARHVGHQWNGQQHRALADAMACRSVWMWLDK